MKRFLAPAMLLALLLTACAARAGEETRTQTLQSRYEALTACTARAEASVVRTGETARYTVELARTDEETRVRVLAPEALSGVEASVRRDGALTLAFDGMVLDAGSALPGVSALNAPDILLDAAAHGYVTERSEERFGETDALRLCFETECSGEKLLVTAYFDADDRPLYAEFERNGEILAYLEFTSFAFGDILTT